MSHSCAECDKKNKKTNTRLFKQCCAGDSRQPCLCVCHSSRRVHLASHHLLLVTVQSPLQQIVAYRVCTMVAAFLSRPARMQQTPFVGVLLLIRDELVKS